LTIIIRSGTCSALLPSCILVPKTSKEVATIVKVLNTNNERFAVKSGGHNPNAGFSSILGGPLISLKALNHVTYNSKSKTANIGPGNRWSDVARQLEPYGVAVASGRVGHVGVGGYISGGTSIVSFILSEY
jgi:FAD/FMN-containing dehydrogenase